MYKIKHIIISFNQKNIFDYKKQNTIDIQNYLTLYKKKYEIQIIAYGLNSKFLHILIRDEKDLARKFIKTIVETLDYYYKKNFNTEVNLMRWKVYEISDSEEMLNTIRYVHTLDYNSNTNYANYSKYINDTFIDTYLVLGSLTEEGKFNFFKEPTDNYIYNVRKKEKSNVNNKMHKRRSRAEKFLNEYLEWKALTREDVLNNDNYKEELVEKFRSETDLSFRDIGYVLGISHTSVIRIWNRSMDNKL